METVECCMRTTVFSAYSVGDIVLEEICSKYPNLKKLTLRAGTIGDISPIASLTQLEELELPHHQIMDIGPLLGLKHLCKLSLKDNFLYDLRGMDMLTNLNEVDLSSNRINEVNVLGCMQNLRRIVLDDNPLTDIGVLQHLPDLEYLSILRIKKLDPQSVELIKARIVVKDPVCGECKPRVVNKPIVKRAPLLQWSLAAISGLLVIIDIYMLLSTGDLPIALLVATIAALVVDIKYLFMGVNGG